MYLLECALGVIFIYVTSRATESFGSILMDAEQCPFSCSHLVWNNAMKFPQVLSWKPCFVVIFNNEDPKGSITEISKE
jgi:hypothetical protein